MAYQHILFLKSTPCAWLTVSTWDTAICTISYGWRSNY